MIKEVSDLKEELVVAEQEKETAMKEKKIAEDFETKLEIERIKLLREVYNVHSIIKLLCRMKIIHVYYSYTIQRFV